MAGCFRTQALASDLIIVCYPPQQEVFSQFHQELKSGLSTSNRYQLLVQNPDDGYTDSTKSLSKDARLVVTVGTQCLQKWTASDSTLPIFSVMVSRQNADFHSNWWRSRGLSFSAIYQDPPPRRQLQLAKALLPRSTNFGYLYAGSELTNIAIVQSAGRITHLEMRAQRIDSPEAVPAALSKILNDSQFLLASADPAIYNSGSLKTILLTSYHHGKALIGSSPGFVRAGGLATTYSSASHVAAQTLEVLKSWRPGEALPASTYARDFDVTINNEVARSLNIPVLDTDALKKLLQARELRE